VEAAKCKDNAMRGCAVEWTELHTRGFLVLPSGRHGLSLDPDQITAETTVFEPIFNAVDSLFSSHRLQGRRAATGEGVSAEVARFEARAQAFLDTRRWSRTASGQGDEAFKRVTDGYALRAVISCKDAMQFMTPPSRPAERGCLDKGCRGGCAKQRFHADSAAPKRYLDAEVPWGDVPLVMLLAIEDGTPFHVRPFDAEAGAELKLTLAKGDLVIFRGDLSHAGGEYKDKDNLRLHVYVDSKLHKRSPDAIHQDEAASKRLRRE